MNGSPSLLYRWPGQGTGRPAVLMAHHDVVPADEPGWAHPPFEPAIVGPGRRAAHLGPRHAGRQGRAHRPPGGRGRATGGRISARRRRVPVLRRERGDGGHRRRGCGGAADRARRATGSRPRRGRGGRRGRDPRRRRRDRVRRREREGHRRHRALGREAGRPRVDSGPRRSDDAARPRHPPARDAPVACRADEAGRHDAAPARPACPRHPGPAVRASGTVPCPAAAGAHASWRRGRGDGAHDARGDPADGQRRRQRDRRACDGDGQRPDRGGLER